MSRRVLLANFMAMVVLSLIAAGLVAFPPPAPPAPQPLLPGFNSGAIAELRLERDARHESATRAAGAWFCTWGDPANPSRWPIADVRIRSALRMLSEATLTPGADALFREFAPDSQLELITSEPQGTSLHFAPTSVAGRAAIAVHTPGQPDRTGLTDDRLHAVFARTGLLPWRDDRAMPAVARDPTRLRITVPAAGDSALELSRVQGHWGLIAPIAERAEAASVQASIDALARLTVVAFRDDTDPAQVGLDTPRVTVQASGGRGPDAYQWRLDIGAPASADGNQVFARLSGHRGDPATGLPLGPAYAVLGLDALSAVFTNPEAYLARTSLATPTPDIRRFSIKTPDAARAWRYERTLDGWQITSPGATAPRPATPAEAAAIPAALEFLVATPAASSVLRTADDVVLAAILEIEGAAGLPAESITLGRSPPAQAAAPGAPPVLVVQAGAVWRRYAEVPQSLATLLPVVP